MANRRMLYTGLVIILTIITVGAIISMKVEGDKPDVYDKYDTDIKYGKNELDDILQSQEENSEDIHMSKEKDIFDEVELEEDLRLMKKKSLNKDLKTLQEGKKKVKIGIMKEKI